MPVGSQEFRAALGHFASSVNVVTARTGGRSIGRNHRDGVLFAVARAAAGADLHRQACPAARGLGRRPAVCRQYVEPGPGGAEPAVCRRAVPTSSRESVTRPVARERPGWTMRWRSSNAGLSKRIPVGTTRSSSARSRRREFGKASRLSIFGAATHNWPRPADRAGLPIRLERRTCLQSIATAFAGGLAPSAGSAWASCWA